MSDGLSTPREDELTKWSKRSAIPKTMTQKQARKLLKRYGWKEGEPGKHQVKMVKEGQPRPIILPHNHNQPYPAGMTKSILKQAGVIGGDDDADS